MKVWIYFLRGGSDGPIKIGYAQDPLRRVRDLNVGSPVQLILLGAMVSARPRLEEQEIHRRLASQQTKGEWFEATAALAEMQRFAHRILNPDDLQKEIDPPDEERLLRNVNLRCTPEEVARWRSAAEARGLSVSAFMRAVCNAKLSPNER